MTLKQGSLIAMGILLVIGVGAWWRWRELPDQKVSRLLQEFSKVPDGPFEPFYLGRSEKSIDDDWNKLGPEAVPALIKTLKDHRYPNRYFAADRLAKIGDLRAIEPLIDCLQDFDPGVRMWSVQALRTMGDPRSVEPIIPLLRDDHSFVRNAAAKALGVLGDKRAVEPLIHSLQDKDWGTRIEATIALKKIGDKRAVEPIRKMIERDKVGSVRDEGRLALQKLE